MRRALVIAGVMLAGLLALVPALAAAAPKPATATGFSIERVSLQRHIGRDVIYVQAKEGDENVTFAVQRGPYTVVYGTTDGKLEGKTITARFGRLGSLHLTLEGPVRHSERCGGRSETKSAFKGEFEFHGEDGYLDFDIHSMQGEAQAVSDICGPRTHARPAAEPRGESTALLAAKSTGHPPAEVLAVLGERTHGRLSGEIFASRAERREGMVIQRTTFAGLRGSQFEWNLARGTATVRPPAPFTGRMSYHRDPRDGAPKITGNLRVPTLGGPDLTLSGRHFTAKLTKELPFDEKRVLRPGAGPLAIASRPAPEPEIDNVVFGLRSQGFTVDVSAVENGDAKFVSLEIGRGPLRATYVAPATITGDSVTAKFGNLGELDFHYGPKPGTRKCSGRLAFTGSFTFTGENGFVHIDAGHADGIYEEKLYAPECGGATKEPAVRVLGRYDGVRLEAKAGTAADGAIRSVEVEEWRTRGGQRKANVRALLVEKLEGMTIGRGVYVTVPAAAFRRDPEAGTATLRPRGPFTGSATLVPGPKGKGTWEGSLTMPILGGEPVEMAGSEFSASIHKSVPRDE